MPHKAFHRNIGSLSGAKVSPDGRVVSDAEWKAKVDEWLPSGADRAYVASLMGRVWSLASLPTGLRRQSWASTVSP